MAQQNFWEQDKEVAAPQGGGGPMLVVAGKPKAPSPQTDAQAEADVLGNEGKDLTNQEKRPNVFFDREKELASRFEAQPAVKAYKDAATSLGVMLRTPDTSGGDIQVIYNYIKSQGPGPVAEGELNLAQSAASFQESLEQKYGKFANGNRLPPRVRMELIEASRQAVAAKKAQFDQIYSQFRSDAERNGLNAESVTGPHPADAVRPLEEDYIRGHGGTPRSATGAPIEDSRPNASDIHFGDEPGNGGNPFNGEQQALFDAWTKANPNATPDQLRSFVASLGIQGDINAEDLIAQRDKLGYIPSATDARRGLTPQEQALVDKRVSETGAAGAGVAGAGDILSGGFMDEAGAGVDAVAGAMRGEGSFSDLYDRNAAVNKAYIKGVQDDHPVAYATGQLLGGLAIPIGYERVGAQAGIAAMREARAAGATTQDAMQVGRQAAARAVRNRMARDGAIMGGVHGAGSGEGVGGRVAGAVGEGAIGAAGGAAFGVAGEAMAPRLAARAAAARAAPISEDARLGREVAHAGQDLNVRVPRFAVGSEADRVNASSVAKSPFGAPAIRTAADNMVSDAQAARQGIVDGVGTSAADPIAMGEAAGNAGRAAVRSERNRIGVLYRRARDAAQDAMVAPTQTMQTLATMIREERAVPGGTKVGAVLERYADAFDQGGPMSIEGARKMRTELRSRLRNEADMTPDAADRLVQQIMGAVGQDVENGLRAAGRDSAIPLFRQADAEWARWMATEDDVLKPYLGRDLRKNGSDVARALMNDANGRGDRLQQFLSAIPEDEANNVRATLIENLGRATSSNQNAEGNTFSLDTFLTNWDKIRDARGRIFAPETVDALNKLAKIAEGSRKAQKVANHSNTGTSIWGAIFGSTGIGALASAANGNLKVAAGAAAGTMGLGLYHLISSRMLASAEFARRLVATPANTRAAAAYWSRPWVASLAKSNPQIATELTDFQNAIMRAANENFAVAPRAAASGNEVEAEGKNGDQ